MGWGEESQNRQTKEKKEKESLLGKGQVAIFFFFLNQNNEMQIPLWVDSPCLWVKQKTESVLEQLLINRTQQVTNGRDV